jgi:hypothetical protein
MVGTIWKQVAGGWRQPRNEELHNLHIREILLTPRSSFHLETTTLSQLVEKTLQGRKRGGAWEPHRR